MQTLFFVQLTSSETRKVLEHIINYVIYKVIIPLSLFHELLPLNYYRACIMVF
jgi:hypothetical protein